RAAPSPIGPEVDLPIKHPDWLRSGVTRQLQSVVIEFTREHGRPPQGVEWKTLLQNINLKTSVEAVGGALSQGGIRIEPLNLTFYRTDTLSGTQLTALDAHPIDGTTLAVAHSPKQYFKRAPVNEAVVAGTLQYLSSQAPNVLDSLLLS